MTNKVREEDVNGEKTFEAVEFGGEKKMEGFVGVALFFASGVFTGWCCSGNKQNINALYTIHT